MRTMKYVFMALAVMGSVAVCRARLSPEASRQMVVEGNSKFALALFAELRAKEGNLFFSPYSISTALAMTYAGAQGRTEAQMSKVLCFPTALRDVGRDPNKGPIALKSTERAWTKERFHSQFGAIIKDLNARGEKGNYELAVANALWAQEGYGLLNEFIKLVEENYGGGLNEVDFVKATESARKTINTWVEKKTNDKIKELIREGVLDSMTRLVLTNAVYFKGNWASQFDKEKTREEPFALSVDKTIDVEMMNHTADFNYMETEDFQALEMPYVDNELSMIVLLPSRSKAFGDFEETLKAEDLLSWLGEMRKREVIVSIPKFKMNSRFNLVSVLKSMGMVDAFSGNADFSGISGKRDLSISSVIHQAYVDVNEEGTEAAAATAVTMKLTAIGPSWTPVFRADHPFLFLIRDNHSGSILFIGRVVNPNT